MLLKLFAEKNRSSFMIEISKFSEFQKVEIYNRVNVRNSSNSLVY